MYGAEQFDRIVAFLNDVGVPVTVGNFGPDGFLKGVTVRDGGLRVDPSHLVASGDLLHEGGHIAVVPSRVRMHLTDDLQGSLSTAAETLGVAGPEIDLIKRAGEPMAIAWSYAALLAADVPADCVFFPDSYRLQADPSGLLHALRTGNSFGIDGLARLGLTGNTGYLAMLYDNGLPPFPHMTRWVVD